MADVGIVDCYWYLVVGGESVFIVFDFDNFKWVYGGSYQGNFLVYDQEIKLMNDIMVYLALCFGKVFKDMKYCFNWNVFLFVQF